MEAFLYTLLAGAISGITFVAYRHPKGYMKIHIVILIIAFIVWAATGIWNLHGYYVWSKIQGVIEKDQLKLIEPMFDSAQLPYTYVSIIYVCVCLYATFLLFLKDILKDDK